MEIDIHWLQCKIYVILIFKVELNLASLIFAFLYVYRR